ncbi:hypothetical protein [Streptomyces sp. NPDC007264]|uniref:hypothetical protein n=1 Tax=Streptomyces sp. NPDC007264 TaxID=3364777 RepID=UPI0036DA6B3A
MTAEDPRTPAEGTGEPGRGAVVTTAAQGAVMTPAGSRALALLRLALGFVFLWAFADKTFGWGYATPAERAWIRGGSPTKGYLGRVEVGPLESTFHAWAGAAWADWLFMLGLVAVGVAFVAGVALLPAAVAGAVMLALMWMAEWPPARHTSGGAPSMSTNPVVDYHAVYALALIALALTCSGDTWGLGRAWARLPFVRGRRWLR